jgi:hypothetical protein
MMDKTLTSNVSKRGVGEAHFTTNVERNPRSKTISNGKLTKEIQAN